MSAAIGTNRWSWRVERNTVAWDRDLADMGGHPLQSGLWGNARCAVDGISQLLLACRGIDGAPIALARIETRSAPLVGKIAWIPKGPVLGDQATDEAIESLRTELRHRGFIACITDRYVGSLSQTPGQPRTIWLDLSLGPEALSKGLDSQWRYGARRAVREGVVVRSTVAQSDVSAFFRLCNNLSAAKGFSLPGSESQMRELISNSSPDSAVGMTLYVGEVGGVIAGGAMVARSGTHLHYFWGASDRQFSKYRVSEAVQWRIIEDGTAAGMTRYDLEGIDPIGNPGVYEFKRKMGGREVTLQGMETTALSWVGRVAVSAGRRLGRLA